MIIAHHFAWRKNIHTFKILRSYCLFIAEMANSFTCGRHNFRNNIINNIITCQTFTFIDIYICNSQWRGITLIYLPMTSEFLTGQVNYIFLFGGSPNRHDVNVEQSSILLKTIICCLSFLVLHKNFRNMLPRKCTVVMNILAVVKIC